jgi:hypothetical protein
MPGLPLRGETGDLVAAIREHAKGSHDHELTREHVLAELGVSPAASAGAAEA